MLEQATTDTTEHPGDAETAKLTLRTSALLLRLRRTAEPAPVFRDLRRLGPVLPTSWGAVLVTDPALARAVLTDPAYRMPDAPWRDTHTPAWRRHPSLVDMCRSMGLLNPPEHTRLRTSLSGAFGTRALKSLAPQIHRITHHVLDDLAAELDTHGRADYTALVAETLPIRVMCAWAGLPQHDAPVLAEYSRRHAATYEFSPTEAELDAADHVRDESHDYWLRRINLRGNRPGEDLLSAWLTTLRPAPDAPDDLTVASTLIAVFVGGYEPPAIALAHAGAALVRHSDQAAALRRDATAVARAVDNLLRVRPPVTMLVRVASQDTVLAGHPVPAGRLVHILIASDAADLTGFATDPPPAPTGHLPFGAGAHYCIGAQLARLQLGVLLPAFATRFPDLRLAGPVTVPHGSIARPAAPRIHLARRQPAPGRTGQRPPPGL
ncbi:cytochrome P450 [Kitasatospora sp. NPDC058218]|uniref:cytochrome P450 n=1 Tax=Kitasatospora sp. NPDC058218 TaxID=3346385 RepID=UPI0036DF5ED9